MTEEFRVFHKMASRNVLKTFTVVCKSKCVVAKGGQFEGTVADFYF
jgi:hypothetical protein